MIIEKKLIIGFGISTERLQLGCNVERMVDIHQNTTRNAQCKCQQINSGLGSYRDFPSFSVYMIFCGGLR